MHNEGEADLVILGGGLAGLTFAWEAGHRGRQVSILERQPQVGGLARTLVFNGYRFDLGGHRFVSAWPEVTRWVQEMMADDLVSVIRRSRIHLGGRYVDYPLQFPSAFTAFSFPQAVRILASYLYASLRRNEQPDISFEDWVVRRFGRGLYDIYFRPYTEKVWGIPCAELSADWASQRIQLPSLTAAVRSSLFRQESPPATLVSRFLYPALGIGSLPERIAAQAQATGCVTLHLNSTVERLEPDGGAWRVYYQQDGQESTIAGRQVISTIPLDRLLRAVPLGDGAAELSRALAYRGIICVLLAVDGPQISQDTWTYFPDHHLIFGRIHEPVNWSRLMAPPDKTSLCLEIFSSEGDAVWQQTDDRLVDCALADLNRLGLLSPDRVEAAWVTRVTHAYPIYRVGYARVLRQARELIARWPTLHLLGRTGEFEYLNMDAVILRALRLADRLADDR